MTDNVASAPYTGTPWYDKRFVSLDFETTHASPEEARVVTAAVVEIGGRRPTTSHTWLVDPGIEIPVDATAVHGVTTEKAREAGEPASDAIAAITGTLERLAVDCPLVAFNAPFDLTTLDRECRRYSIRPLQDRAKLLVVDPRVLDMHLHRYRKSYPPDMTPEQATERGVPSSRTLAGMCAHYRIVLLDAAHDATLDARAAAFLARRLAREARVIRRDYWEAELLNEEWDHVRGDIHALHAAQVEWARMQNEGLRDYFARNGLVEKAAAVRTSWPLVLPNQTGARQ